jgi:WD40 repeat protein
MKISRLPFVRFCLFALGFSGLLLSKTWDIDESIAVTQDGKFGVVGSTSGSLTLWDLESYRVVGHYSGFTKTVTAIAFDRLGTSFIAVAPDEKLANLYKVSGAASSRKPMLTLRNELSEFDYNAIGFGCNNSVISGARDGMVRQFTVGDTTFEQYGGHRGPVITVSASPDCNFLATGGADGNLAVWRQGRTVPQFVHTKESAKRDAVTASAWSIDGQFVAAGTESGNIWVFKTDGSQVSFIQDPQSGIVNSLAFSRDDSRLLSACEYEKARVWNIKTRQLLGELGKYASNVLAVAGDRVFVAGNTLEVWSISTLQPIRMLRDRPYNDF